MKHIVMMLALTAFGVSAAEKDPVVAAQSAFIQIMSKIDGTQSDIEIPGIPDLGHSIWSLAEDGQPDLVSAWIDGGVSELDLLAGMSCVDRPQDFSIEDRGQSWFYRDTRELSCSAVGQAFLLVVEVGIEQAEEKSSWKYTTLQSVNSLK